MGFDLSSEEGITMNSRFVISVPFESSSDVAGGDVGLGRWGLGDSGTLGGRGTRGRDNQTTPDFCAKFVKYNFWRSSVLVSRMISLKDHSFTGVLQRVFLSLD